MHYHVTNAETELDEMLKRAYFVSSIFKVPTFNIIIHIVMH